MFNLSCGALRLEPIMAHNKALVRTQTTLRFVCAAQLGRWAHMEFDKMRFALRLEEERNGKEVDG